jgi:DNA repair photolyase
MIKEIQAKVMLNPIPQPDTWFGLKYTMNLYRGCQHSTPSLSPTPGSG